MYTVRLKHRFEYAHQLVDAYSKCCIDTIHGHSAVIEIFIRSEKLDNNGMVIDFGELKELVIQNIDLKYDHALIISAYEDVEYVKILREYNQKFILSNKNPTAEFLAQCLYQEITDLLKPYLSIHLEKIRFHETENGYAEYCPSA